MYFGHEQLQFYGRCWESQTIQSYFNNFLREMRDTGMQLNKGRASWQMEEEKLQDGVHLEQQSEEYGGAEGTKGSPGSEGNRKRQQKKVLVVKAIEKGRIREKISIQLGYSRLLSSVRWEADDIEMKSDVI